jgi:hypothetical protein
VRRGAAAYERELKELLQGNPEALRKYGRRMPPVDRKDVESHGKRPFLVVRAAGSFGFDLVALRPEFAFPVEVKASAETTIRFSASSGRAHQQLEEHRRDVARVGLLVVYAYRLVGTRSGDSWRLFATGTPPVDGGRMRLLGGLLPAVDTTREGHGVLRWEAGLPLTDFLRRVQFLTDRTGATTA